MENDVEELEDYSQSNQIIEINSNENDSLDEMETEHTQIEYDIEDCYMLNKEVEELISIQEPTETDLSNTMLEPDHPLLATFQQSLKRQLERLINKLTEEIHENEIGIKTKNKEYDTSGIAVYDTQQLVMQQQKTLDQYDLELNKMTTEYQEIEKDRNELLNAYKKNKNTLNEIERKEKELSKEVETINYMMKQMKEWEDKLQSNLAVNQRISDKTKINKRQFSDEKRNLDFFIYKLMTEIFRLENNLDDYEMQLRVKEQEREDLANAISKANADIESLSLEHKRLMHAWNCVLSAIGYRDKIYLTTKKQLDEQTEILQTTIVEIESVKKLSAAEMNRNEQLTLIKGRIDMAKTSINARYQRERDKLKNLEKKLIDTQIILTQIVQDLEQITGERKLKEQDLDRLRREVEKNMSEKLELEDKIMNLLQQQIVHDKISKYMNKTINEYREKNRALEIQLATIENQNSDILVEIEHQKAENEELMRSLEETIKEQRKGEEELNEKKHDIQKVMHEIKKREFKFESVNKKLEEIISKTGDTELSPHEQKMKYLERQINDLNEKNQQLKHFWLRQESFIINLKEQRTEQLYELNITQKQVMLLQQKNLKLEDELEEFKRQKNQAERNITNIKNKTDKINDEIVKKRGQKAILDSKEFDSRNKIVLKLETAEMECIQMESELYDMEDERMSLTKEVLDANRDTLTWECKMKLALETRATISKEKSSEGELGDMRDEIHRMTVRYGQLKKAQDKLIQDLNHCLMRRENIFVNAEATEKRMATTTGQTNNRLNFKRKLEDWKNKIKKIENEIKLAEKKVTSAIELEKEMNDQIAVNERTIDHLNTQIIEITTNIGTAKDDRQKELENLVFQQNKLHAYTSISKQQYRCSFCSNNLDMEYVNQQKLNSELQTVVENLILDFPQHYPTFSILLHTLKIVNEDLKCS